MKQVDVTVWTCDNKDVLYHPSTYREVTSEELPAGWLAVKLSAVELDSDCAVVIDLHYCGLRCATCHFYVMDRDSEYRDVNAAIEKATAAA